MWGKRVDDLTLIVGANASLPSLLRELHSAQSPGGERRIHLLVADDRFSKDLREYQELHVIQDKFGGPDALQRAGANRPCGGIASRPDGTRNQEMHGHFHDHDSRQKH